MGALYITGAVCYAMRMPERFYPGRFDYWVRRRGVPLCHCCSSMPWRDCMHAWMSSLCGCYFTRHNIWVLRPPPQLSSHQVFHVFVVAAATWHYSTVMEQYEWRVAHTC